MPTIGTVDPTSNTILSILGLQKLTLVNLRSFLPFIDCIQPEEMEKLETKLFEAAAKGCITSLQKLLKDDPLILDRVLVNSFSETPLHVAAMLGHIDFVKEIISIKPVLTNELNSQKSSPLHLASAKGHVEVVRALLSVDRRPCLARDRNGLTPVHLAAMKGRVEVMKMLLQVQPDATRLAVYKGENILHLCIKYYQLEALKLLVTNIGDPEFINSKDGDGNTILHLAVADKQVETIEYLLTVATLEVNALNLEGMTSVDVLTRSRRDVRDLLIKESLIHAGGFGTLETNIANQKKVRIESCKNNTHYWLEKKKNALMVVASLIATMAFQVGVNPPGGVWQEDEKSADSKHNAHEAGSSILAHKNRNLYLRFYIVNTIGFVASLSIILLLMSGLPIRRRFFMWILMVITWIAITATVITYLISIGLLTPSYRFDDTILNVLTYTVLGWLGLMALLLVCHTIRLLMKMVKTLVKIVKRLSKTLRGRTVEGPAPLENNVAP